MDRTTEVKMVFVTTDSFEDAKHIARILITEKIAACCSIIQNVFSVFGWHSAIQERHEYTMMIKTTAEKLNELEARVNELHSDEVPEMIAVDISDISVPYMGWIKQVMAE
jgi:periplasmic divalent cation tolerance protein